MSKHTKAQLDTLANVCEKLQHAYYVARTTPSSPHVVTAAAVKLIAAWVAYDAVADAKPTHTKRP